ncbi:252_t:CDS:2, partial [Acaulospora morrowiae]
VHTHLEFTHEIKVSGEFLRFAYLRPNLDCELNPSFNADRMARADVNKKRRSCMSHAQVLKRLKGEEENLMVTGYEFLMPLDPRSSSFCATQDFIIPLISV